MSRPLKAARKQLGDGRLLAFLEAVRANTECRVIAAGMVLGCVEEEGLEAGLASFAKAAPEPWAMRMKLEVERLSPRVFRITFGLGGGHVGDGGTWRVVYTAKGAVQHMEQEAYWMN